MSSCHHTFADISWIRIFFVGILWVRGSVIIILVGILWIQNFFTWVFRQSKSFFVFCGSKDFPRRYFVGQISYLVDILQVHIFFSWVFVDPIFICGYFMASNIFFAGLSWFQNSFSWIYYGSEMFSCGYSWVDLFLVANFVLQRFLIAGCMRKGDREQG